MGEKEITSLHPRRSHQKTNEQDVACRERGRRDREKTMRELVKTRFFRLLMRPKKNVLCRKKAGPSTSKKAGAAPKEEKRGGKAQKA